MIVCIVNVCQVSKLFTIKALIGALDPLNETFCVWKVFCENMFH